jgi:hypothetical protein
MMEGWELKRKFHHKTTIAVALLIGLGLRCDPRKHRV